MCNAYTVRLSTSARQLAEVVSGEVRSLPSPLVRRTGRGVVVKRSPAGLEAATMRWGFSRPVSDAINNARSDKIHSPTWKEALAGRRCIVPISGFYEWQALPGGRKQAYEFRRPDGEWMWVAGLYEFSEKYGMCYATITTDPPEWMVPIHDRMLAVLDLPDALAFLDGQTLSFRPYGGRVDFAACESPLRKRSDGGGQAELF